MCHRFLQVFTRALHANYSIRFDPAQNPLTFSHMEYGDFKGLQALLFFGIPLAWGIWQLIVLRRDAQSEKGE